MILTLLILANAANAELPMPSFLAGCWEEKRTDGWTEECWTSARGGLMIGSGRDGAADRVRHWEWMRIQKTADGSVTLYGSPKGATPVAFQATASDGRSITFLNKSHDYPQRVTHRLTESGLHTQISLADGSRPNRWNYQRPGRPSAD